MTDYSRIESILDELYASISGPAGPRDFDRELRLFHPAARLMRTGRHPDGRPWIRVMTPGEYHADTAAFFAAGDFHEIELARETERFGNIAWVRSVYEARRRPGDAEVLARGVNSIQMYHDGDRWWILSVLWDNEREGLSLPDDWLGPEARPSSRDQPVR